MASEQHVCFSPDGKLFALINNQGILRIWDTDTNELKQEYTPSLHLTGPCTALVWVKVADNQQTPGSKKKKLQKLTTSQLYIALGTSTGQVSLYSFSEGTIARNLKGEGHAGRVTAIVRGDADVIYTSGEDCQIISWSLASQERLTSWAVGPEKPQSIAYLSHSKKLAVGSRQIKVYSVESHELVQSYTGHTAEVNLMSAICIAKEKVTEYALSTSVMERIICLWNISKKGQNQTAACTLLMEDIAYLLESQIDEKNEVLKIFSVTRSGVVHLYLIPFNKFQADKPIKPKITIEIASDGTSVVEPIPAVAVSVDHGASSEDVLIGYGDRRFMMFERIKPAFVEKKQVLVRANPKKLLQKSRKSTNSEGLVSTLKTLTPIINPADVDYKSAVTVSKKHKIKPTEIPMESRLQNLNIGTPATVGSQSKVQLLVQALHSKDDGLLNSVLQTNDTKTIELTLQKLPVQYVGPLVNELTTRMQKKRVNVEYSVKWLKVLVQTHSSQLMALGSADLQEKFGPCIGIIEQRTHCLEELSKLSGRLNLVVNQIKRNTEKALDTENVFVYEDRDSSDSDLEDSKEQSEGEWDEGDSEDDDDDDDDEDDAEDMEVNGADVNGETDDDDDEEDDMET